MVTEYHAKLFAYELSKRHSVADSEKLAGALLDAQVDLNPHQVEAALFAFKSPLSKGAILADEVGLGKTIEAGLVLAQKWAEGKRRILIITPASLRKQWSQEVEEKFFLPTLILEAKNYKKMLKNGARNPFDQQRLVICSFQFAARHAEDLLVIPWDLVVIDEAHRLRNVYRPDNRIGRTLKGALINAPKILLTATPLQNSLMELYGLVSLIDDFTFGDAKSFRAKYARLTGDDQFEELKQRLQAVCHRTLRRQVLEYIRYTNRIPITQEFVPTEAEQALYEMVSEYLRRPSLHALPSSQRTLMTLIMRKLLASSTFAIAGALDSLARKLERQLKQDTDLRSKLEEELAEDYEEFDELADEWPEGNDQPELLSPEDVNAIKTEIFDLREFRDLAVSISENAKGQALLSALRAGFAKTQELGAAQKAIIFTESRRTQEYLVRLLSDNDLGDQLVLFNGSNNDAESKAIYEAWLEKHKGSDRVTGSRTADMRAALVEHFREQASIMIATEAAAEGINLQFCSIVVNYDLPWNPQRIEQRIGRCHRYGQLYDVVVVNFLNRNNAADQRVYELLAEKFQLFSGVFGASDEVLGSIESGVEFEKRIVSIYQNCRTSEEIEAEFSQLRGEMDENISAAMEDTRRKLLENFDAEVHDRLKINLDKSKEYIGRYERMLWTVTRHELRDRAQFDDEHLTFTLKEPPIGLAVPPGGYGIAKNGLSEHRYRLGHPLAQHVIECAKAAPYAVPYDGREVYLHWANRDQYYIKTSEYLTNFTFDPTQAKEFQEKHGALFGQKPLKVHCRIISASEGEHNNVKASEQTERYFIIHEPEPMKIELGDTGEPELVIQFQYRPDPEKTGQDGTWRKKRLAEAADKVKATLPDLEGAADYVTALMTPAPTEAEKDRTLLEKYLTQYTSRNTMDYFIHKDLGGFLRRELDFYIKNEVMRLDEIESADAPRVEAYLAKIKVLRRIAQHLINFLAQLEDFQKRLWLKRKFVVDTQYCVSMALIPDEYLKEVSANKAQVQEWIAEFCLDEIAGFTDPPSPDFLRKNEGLLLDTAYFSDEFKQSVVSNIQLGEDINSGELICGENSQALRLIRKTYESNAHCIYIDPPYNTDASAIAYKNGYKSSSWLGLINERLHLAKDLLPNDGVICVAIDDEQLAELSAALGEIFPVDLGTAVVRSNPQSRKSRTTLSPSHEYALFFGKTDLAKPSSLSLTDKRLARYPLRDEKGHYSWMSFIRTGTNELRTDRPKMHYPIIASVDGSLRIPDMTWHPDRGICGEYEINENLAEGEIAVYPVSEKDGKVIEKRWHRGWERVLSDRSEYRVRRDKNGKTFIDFKTRIDEKSTPSTWWDKPEYASANYGAIELKALFGEKPFDFPKAVALVSDCIRTSTDRIDARVLDFFAGSGTTVHSLISLNREDGGRRKFIAVEMGNHFGTVLLPRVKKAAYACEWEDGKPTKVANEKHFIRYFLLETYEDALNNLTFAAPPSLPADQKDFYRDYKLRYWLDFETKGRPSLLNIEGFEDPTAYKLKIKKPGTDEYVEKAVDLVETFNWLIGLHVEHLDRWRGYNAAFKREVDPELPEDMNTRLMLDGVLKEADDGAWRFRKVEGYTLRTPGDHNDREKALVVWRKLTGDLEQDNLMLDEWFRKYRLSAQDTEFDVIYVNGSNNLPNLRKDEETWKVRLIEEAFHQAMWDVEG